MRYEKNKEGDIFDEKELLFLRGDMIDYPLKNCK